MSYKITSYFGSKEAFRDRPHKGIDFKMEEGTPLRSIFDGKILDVVDYGKENIGRGVFVQWQDGKVAIYGHMSEINVQPGQMVRAGDLLGYSGNTGNSLGAHLHFGLKNGNGDFIDPSPYISQIQAMNSGDIQQLATGKLDFMSYFQQHMDLIGEFMNSVKLNLIQLLPDYIPFIQFLQNTAKLFLLNL